MLPPFQLRRHHKLVLDRGNARRVHGGALGSLALPPRRNPPSQCNRAVGDDHRDSFRRDIGVTTQRVGDVLLEIRGTRCTRNDDPVGHSFHASNLMHGALGNRALKECLDVACQRDVSAMHDRLDSFGQRRTQSQAARHIANDVGVAPFVTQCDLYVVRDRTNASHSLDRSLGGQLGGIGVD